MENYQFSPGQLSEIGKEMLISLCQRYFDDKGFRDDNRGEGLIYRCAGSVSLLLLVNTFEDLENVSDDWKKIVINEFKKVREHINRDGYDATPCVAASEGTRNLFSPKAEPQYYYMDSVSWVLSFCLLLRLASRKADLEIPKDIIEEIKKTSREALEIIVANSCPGGGWGFSSGCTSPDLYYSYAVSSALADFGDYVLGESPEVVGEDKIMQEYLGKELLARIREKRLVTYEWLKRDYREKLSQGFVHPSHEKVIAESWHHSLLYYIYFVIDMFAVNSLEYKSDPEWPLVKKSIEHGIYYSRIAVDAAIEDKDWWEDADESSLSLSWENHPEPDKVPKNLFKKSNPNEPGLVPLTLRCNSLYTYYIAEGEDAKMGELFQLLIETRNSSNGLWDKWTYDLLVTERAVEAIVEYSDYLKKFVMGRYHKTKEEITFQSVSPLEEAIRSIVKKEIENIQSDDNLLEEQPTTDVPMPLSENVLLDLLVSTLNGANASLRGKPTKIELGSYPKRFIEELMGIINAMAHLSLEKRFPACNDKELLFKRWDKDIDELIKSVGVSLQVDPTWNLGKLFHFLVSGYVKNSTSRGQKP